MQARIVKILSKDYTLQFENGERVSAVAMGKVRLQTTPVVGDIVETECIQGKWGIQQVLDRKNKLIRPPVANVDQAIIVMSTKDPDFSAVLIDRLSFLIVHAGIKPVLCVTKCDLGINDEIESLITEYENGPIQVIRCGMGQLDPRLSEILKDKVTVLTGQSGAGKSTLLNGLEPSFQLKTQEISKALGRGKHTTRHSELHKVADGLVADTPGFSSLDFSHMNSTELAESVLEFQPYIGTCKFNDCVHQNEPGCKIKEAVENKRISKSRYMDYIQILEQIQNRREKY